jgi:hypothetical protein
MFLSFYVFNIRIPGYVNPRVIPFLCYLCSYLLFLNWYFFSEHYNKIKIFLRALAPHFFLTGILLFSCIIFCVEYLNILDTGRYFIISIFIISIGIFTVLTHRKVLLESLSSSKNTKDHTLVRGFNLGILKKTFVFLVFFCIIFISVFIKIPYFSNSFTGEHTMKYNTYVEPAMHMQEQKNPFFQQTKYYIDPISNPEGIYSYFWTPPIMSWGILTTFILFPENSTEINVRLFTSFIGILILISAYFALKPWLNRELSLLTIFFLSINPIFSFATFVTVIDSVLLLMSMLSIIALNFWTKKGDDKYFIISALIFGLGNAFKYSITLWFIPALLLFIYFYYKKEINNIVTHMLLYFFTALVPFLIAQTSIRYLPSHPKIELLSIFIWIAILTLIFKYQKKITNTIKKAVELCISNQIILVSFFILFLITLSSLIFFINNGSNLVNETLTDRKLIFNLNFYKYMIVKQFIPYATYGIFLLGGLGCFFALLLSSSRASKFILTISFSVIIYWILASKVIFFHNYYTIPIMFALSMGVAFLFYILILLFKKHILPTIAILISIVLVLFPSYKATSERLGTEKIGVYQAAQYLVKNTKDGDIYIDDNFTLTLTILTNRSRVEIGEISSNLAIKESIRENGFSKTMSKYNIKYLVTTNSKPDFYSYANLFSNEPLQSNYYRRSDTILSKIEPEHYQYFTDSELRKKIIQQNNVESKFVLEHQVGVYKFYRFRE